MTDLNYAVRQLLKNPGFTTVAILTLALGIGANTAIFSFVNAILIRPLPYPEADRLVMVFENNTENGWSKNRLGAPVLGEWRKLSTSFEGLAGYRTDIASLSGRGNPESISLAEVSANTFGLLRIKPFIGRDFLPEEETYGRQKVAILSYEFWKSRFGGDRAILGQSLQLDSEPYTVVGVMPPRLSMPASNTKAWTPLAFSPERLAQRHNHTYMSFARLKPGVTLGQARQDMKLVSRRMAEADQSNKGWGSEVYPLHEIVVGDTNGLLLALQGAVGLVLLIACANVANLFVARAGSRAREFAVRAALGARRGQMIRQVLAESLLLSAIGGAAGAGLAALALEALIKFSPPDLPRIEEGIPIDAGTLLFTLAVILITGTAFGLIPAFQCSNPALAQELGSGGRGNSAGRPGQRLRSALVIAEVALSLMLLAAGGLMVKSFGRLLSEPMGFQPEHLVAMSVGLPDKKYPDQAAKIRLFEELIAQVRAMPGVDSAGLVYGLPFTEAYSDLSVSIPGAAPFPTGEGLAAAYFQASPGYFNTLQMQLLQGRDFDGNDRAGSPPALIVNEQFVKEFRLGTNVIGRKISIGDSLGDAEIIGVVRGTKRTTLANQPGSAMYRTYKQICWGYMSLGIRTRRDPQEIGRSVRAALDKLDKDVPLDGLTTMTRMVASSLSQQRLSVRLFSGFAATALVLAAIGLYGVLACLVSQRTREIGIRMALGAQRDAVLRMVLRQGMILATLGIGAGLAGALAVGGLLRKLLYGVEPSGPTTFSATIALLAAVAFMACWLPASRATRVDPMIALRQD